MASFGANKGFGTGGFGSSTFGNSLTTQSWNQPQNQLAIAATPSISPNADWFGDGSGSSLIEFRSTVGKDTSSHTSIYYQSLVFQPEYKRFSVDELRLQDYMDGRVFGENPNANKPKPNGGTKNCPFAETKEKDLIAGITVSYQSLMLMPQYRGNSQEELRMEDYRQGATFQGDSNSLLGSKPNTFGSFGSGSTSAFGSTGFGAATTTSALGNSTGFGSSTTGGFGVTASQGSTGFGQKPASGFGNTNTGFGQAASGFGASTTGFGQASNSGFGATSTGFGQTSASGFGNTNTGFGQPASSGFGQNSSGFGNTSSAFGQAKTGFGQSATAGFGQAATTGFGQAATTGFGQAATTGFGQTANTGFGQTASSGFGQTTNTGFGQAANTGFGQAGASAFGQTAISGFGQSKPGFGAGFGQNSNSGFGQPSNLGTSFGINSNLNPQQGINLQSNDSSVANSLGVSVLLHSLNPNQNNKNLPSIPPPVPSFSVSHPYGYISLLEDLKSDSKLDKKDEAKTEVIKPIGKPDANPKNLINEDVVFSNLRSTTRYTSNSGFNFLSESSSFNQDDAVIDSVNDPSEIFRSSSINPAFITQPLRYNVPLRYAAIRTAAMSPSHVTTSDISKEVSKNQNNVNKP